MAENNYCKALPKIKFMQSCPITIIFPDVEIDLTLARIDFPIFGAIYGGNSGNWFCYSTIFSFENV